MKSKLAHLFLKEPYRFKFWLLLSLLFKSAPFIILLIHKPVNDIPGFVGGSMGDTPSYLNPIDSLLSAGIYAPDFRMPGYGIVYLLFRLFASKAAACNLIILLQFVLAALSVYFFSLTVMRVFKSKSAFYISFYLLLVSTYSNFYDGYLLTESFCSSALIFSAYYFVRWNDSYRLRHILLSGIFLTWVIFLRPVFLPLTALFGGFIIMQSTTVKLSAAKYVMAFLIPFLICDGVWIIRNYIFHKKLIPLTSSILYPQVGNTFIVPLTSFVQSWGGCTGYTDNNSALGWFGYYITGTPKQTAYDSLPGYIYTTAFNRDSLLLIRNLIEVAQNPATSPAVKSEVNNQLISKLGIYRRSFIREKPVLYYIYRPLRLLGEFLYGRETKLYLKRGQVFKSFGILIEGFYTIFYLFILVAGLPGILLMAINGIKHNRMLLLPASIPIYTIVIHPLILHYAQNRYLMPAWSFIIAGATYTMLELYRIYPFRKENLK